MAGSGNSEVITSIFSSENYDFWRIKMVAIFKSYDLWNPDAKALGIIQNAVSDQIFPRIANAESAKTAWEMLMHDNESLSAYLTRLNDLINQMKRYGEVLSNKRLVQKVLISLRKIYDHICLAIENTKSLEIVELQEVIAILKSQKQRFKLHNADATEKALASFTMSPKASKSRGCKASVQSVLKVPFWRRYKGKPKCYNCDKFGHLAKECTAGKYVQKANCANQVEVTGNLFYANCATIETKPNGDWYIDSGCSNHMTDNVDLLVDVRTNVAGKVQMPTGALVSVASMGSLIIETTKGRKYIREVMYLPGLRENLLSVGQMDEHGYFLVFGDGMCKVFDSSSMNCLIIKVPMKKNRCYPLSFLSENQLLMKASITHCTWTLHKRLGHLHFKRLRQLRDKDMVHGLPQLEEQSGVCEGCQLGKQHRNPFQKSQAQRASILLEIVHADLCGPMRNESIARNKYFMLLIDDYTRMMGVFLDKQKRRIGLWLKWPSLFNEKEVPYCLWVEAVHTAVYILNKCPTKALNNVTPFETYSGRKPDKAKVVFRNRIQDEHKFGVENEDENVAISPHIQVQPLLPQASSPRRSSDISSEERNTQAYDHSPLKWRRLNDVLAQCNLCIIEPEKYVEAAQEKSWLKAMEDELKMIEKNVQKNKARLVAKGYAQKPGLDYNETYAHVPRLDTIRTLIALAAQKEWKLYQLDVPF
ncbi:hypothetical protein L3X38_000527 [Prunus dulcis]|uniref:CCHC-type domain-containing protein n=1 Tax=Prunus dulcis TaxID=3755 RepID=A0AAD4WQB9_PRUDU|nr:hypothetical protein L3X38_000527 [Prunus dulcis]